MAPDDPVRFALKPDDAGSLAARVHPSTFTSTRTDARATAAAVVAVCGAVVAVGFKVLDVVFFAVVVGPPATEVDVVVVAAVPVSRARLAASGKPPFTAGAFNASGSSFSTLVLSS